MSAAVATGLFTLGGVVVGGIVNGAVTLWLERRREGWLARKDARLFIPRLNRIAMATAEALDDQWTWAELCAVAEANLEDWDEFAEAFAATLHWDEWFTVYTAVRAMQQMTLAAPEDADQVRIGPQDSPSLQGLIDKAAAAVVVLVMVAISGAGRQQPIRRGLRQIGNRFRRPDDEKMLAELGFGEDEIKDILGTEERGGSDE